MKKLLPYIIAGIVVILLLWLITSTGRNNHVLDERISFSKRDKIPYGMYVAYENLSRLFPSASISVNKKEPARWDSLTSLSDKQAMIIITPRFSPDEFELNRLLNFAKAGNTVFISSRALSSEAQSYFNCETYFSSVSIFADDDNDTLSLSLQSPPFEDAPTYVYPGKQFDSYFGKYDKDVSYELGRKNEEVDFIQLRAGKGQIYVHLAPLAFSNYFLLHGNNINYYNKTLSLIPADTRKVVWDEYYLHKRYSGNNSDDGSAKSIFSALMSQRSFRAAVWLLIALSILFILQEMRRKQNVIPAIARPRNDSLEFVKTIGRLYYEKRDNKNLSRKMAAYFLEHIRNRYKLSTTRLDEEFIQSLERKTARSEDNIRKIVLFINNIEFNEQIDDQALADFHRELEEFYKTA